MANPLTKLAQSSRPLAAIGLLLAFCASHLAAQDRAPKSPTRRAAAPDNIRKWVGDLNSDSFTVRQAAADRLLEAGGPARDALVPLIDSPDPETRAAARRLVALIARSEFNRRLEAFAADVDGKRGLKLPGWERFRELVGADAPARSLFVDMHRAEGQLIAATFGKSGAPPDQLWEERLSRLVSWQVMNGNRSTVPPLGSCAAMIFLGSVQEMNVSDQSAGWVDILVQRPPISESIGPNAQPDAVRRLVVGWLTYCPNKNEISVRRRMQLASMLGLKDVLPLGLAIASGEDEYTRLSPTARAEATLMVGQFGDEAHVKQIEPLLDDTVVCMPVQAAQPGQPVANVQIRDVAMVVLLQLTDQKPSDYGYHHARLQPHQSYHLQTLHIADDAARTNAITKWKTWRTENKTLLDGKPNAAERKQKPAVE